MLVRLAVCDLAVCDPKAPCSERRQQWQNLRECIAEHSGSAGRLFDWSKITQIQINKIYER